MWHTHYMNTYPEKVLARRMMQVRLTSDVHVAFEMLKKACLEAPVLVFADIDMSFLLETNASKLGLGVVLSQRQPDR